MAAESFRASAPGNLMLMGEHAVLRNRHAIVCAVNRRIRVTLTPRKDRLLRIESGLGNYEGPLGELPAEAPFQFVHGTIAHFHHRFTTGLDLNIHSDFSDNLGLGSSAAVTVAMVAATSAWQGQRVDAYDVFHTSRKIIREVQGTGSGADVAASVFGGVVAYRPDPLHIERLGSRFPISVYYSGGKVPTVEVIRRVDALAAKYPDPVRGIMLRIGEVAEAAVTRFKTGDLQAAGELMNINHGLMDALGLCNRKLADMVYQLREQPGIYGAKISGAGLGDCIIGIGTGEARLFDYDRISLEIADQGMKID